MNKKQIEMVLAIENFKSITKAADFLGITQATLSKFLATLEKKLQTKIFYRYSREVIPSEEGKIVLKSFKCILDEYNKLESSLMLYKEGEKNEFSLGTHQVLGRSILPQLEKELSKVKNLNIKYKFNNSRILTENIANGKLDFAIVADPQKYPDIVMIPLWKEYIGLYSIDGLPKEDIYYNSNMIFANKFLKRIDFKNTNIVDDYSILYSMLKNLNAMGLLPNPIAESENKLKLIKKFRPSIDICLIYSANKQKSKAFTEFISLIKETSKKSKKHMSN